jgi:hypothetical protein
MDRSYVGIMSNNSNQDFELFLDMMIGELGTLFTTPEEHLVVEGEKSTSMSLIVAGSCFMS